MPNHHTTAYTYDPLNRLTSTTGPDAPGCGAGAQCVNGKAATVYGFDEVGNLTRRTDPNGHATALGYDTSGRLVEKVDALGRNWRYTHDRDGNLTQVVTPKATLENPTVGTISQSFDRAGRLTGIDYGDARPDSWRP